MSALTELQEALASVAAGAGPSVVGIGRRHRGAGFVIAQDRVLTNAHNVRGATATVRFAGGRAETGTVVGVDWDGDLAVIDVPTEGATPIEWSEGGVNVGSLVLAVTPTPTGTVRATFGFVSAMEQAFRGPGGRRIAGSLEHTAPLAPGSSGSPVLDVDGRAAGISTNRVGEGFYLALPADAALRDRVDALARGESRERPRLGIAVAPAHVARRLRQSVGLPPRDGVLVRDVEEGSPAAVAGIAQGDLLVGAGGRSIADVDDLHEALSVAGLPVEITVVRGTDERTITVAPPEASAGEGDAAS
jgi:S1-C subfamily serine protease